MIDPRLIKPAYAPQLKLGSNELRRIEQRIEDDYQAAIADHDARMERFRRYYMRWRNRTESAELGEELEPNYQVPITQWDTWAKLAKEMASLFGADAEVVARPVGPSDQRTVRKVSRFMNWLLFSAMKIVSDATVFGFRKILFGKAHAYAPWVIDEYDVPLIDGTMGTDTYYEGPGFEPLWPDDVIVPAEEAKTIHDFSFVIRRYRATPDDLLRGEGSLYQGITANFEKILQEAESRRQQRSDDEPVKAEKDLAEGVIYEGAESAANCLVVWEWYGRWRKLKGGRDARIDSVSGRQLRESDLVVRYLPDLHLTIGVQDLADMYPRKRNRRPFNESSLVKDGSYWPPGFGELLERIEEELSKNHQLAAKATAFSVGPVIFYRPDSGFDPETFEYQPFTSQASADPNGIKVVQLTADLRNAVLKNQELISYGERVTGLNDMNVGRALDRPNAPKTARQTLALLEEGDVRASLDMSALREDWGLILDHFWQLYSMYGPEKTFFRVTEEEAGGLFDVAQGGAYMKADELGGRFDFDLKFATNAWSRETQKQNQLALYQLDLQNPLVVQNPRALWMVLDRIHRAFGDEQFGQVIPQPADFGLPVEPREEHVRVLQGEQLLVNPMDNDQLHLLEHTKYLERLHQDPDRDQDAYDALITHAQEHIAQMKQKQLMGAMASSLAQSMAQATATGRGLASIEAPVGLQDVHATLGEMMGNGTAPAGGAVPGDRAA